VLRVRLGALVALIAVGVAACSGGGNFIPTSHPTSTPTGGVVAGASSSPETPISSSGAAVSASSGGDAATVTVAGSGEVAASVSTITPSSVPALQAVRSAGKTTASHVRGALDANGNTPILYIALLNGATSTTTLTGFPATTITAASVPSGNFYLAYYDGAEWDTIAGPGTYSSSASSGNTIKFSAVTFDPSILIAAGGTVYFCVYAGAPLPSPGPSTAPSGSPSTSPSGSPSTSPSRAEARG